MEFQVFHLTDTNISVFSLALVLLIHNNKQTGPFCRAFLFLGVPVLRPTQCMRDT
jgi:hypothetical protein